MSAEPKGALVYTAPELVEEAHKLGFKATQRLIADWAELGLLDRPQRRPLGRGRGSAKAVWPESQKDLLLTLLQHRQTVNHVAPLANIPVWTWLAFGDEWVPLRQTRRALGTWCGRHRSNVGVSATEASRMAKKFVATVVQPQTHPHDRGALRRLVEESLRTMTFDQRAFRNAVRRVFDPNNEGRVIGPTQAPLNPEVLVRGVEARFTALQRLDAFTDRQFDDARLVFLTTKEMYAEEWATLARDPETGHMHPGLSVEREVNRACYDLFSILGLNFLSPQGLAAIEKTAAERGII